MSPGERAKQLFESGHYCAEAVLQALAEQLDIQSEIIPQIASGFCSGMSRTSGPCGAVTGCIMGLGVAFGRKAPEKSDLSREKVQVCYALNQEFMEAFVQKHGSTNCLELTGCDFNTAQGQQKFKAENGVEKCAGYVRDAADMAWEIMESEGEFGTKP